MHLEDNHRGINSLSSYIEQRLYYVVGETFLTRYIIKNGANCIGKASRTKLKREPGKQILTNYPKYRYVMDLSELPKELYTNKTSYLFSIIEHFSK